MKKIFIIFVMLFSLTSFVYATDANVQINGKIIDFTDSSGKVNARIINERTMVPFRKVFNELGINDDNIIYTSSEEPITAKGDNVEIVIQIGNSVAQKIENGVTTTINLDSAPVVIDGRTLVPLRFIAESLGKTVAWDSKNNTAVIIDYDYFENELAKYTNLYSFLNNNSSQTEFSITRNYYDNEDSSKNNNAIVSGRINETKTNDSIIQNVTVDFSGTNELMTEIASEGWNNIQFENTFTEKSITSKALSDGLIKLYGANKIDFNYSELNCEGKYNDSLSNLFKTVCNIDENSINVSTFEMLKNDFDSFVKLFKLSNTSKFSSGNINSNDINLNYFDFTKFDNVIYDNAFIRTYNFLNSQLFKYDVKLSELCYDYPTINFDISVSNSELLIDFVGTNEYNEKVEYIIKINKL